MRSKKLTKKREILIALLVLLLAAALMYFFQNPAQKKLRPIQRDLVSLHPVKLCAEGHDNRFNLDESSTYYIIYYLVDAPDNLTQRIKSIAAAHNYVLQTDKSTIKQLQEGSGVPGERYYPAADYLAGVNGNTNLSVEIIKSGAIPLSCGVDSTNNFKTQPASQGKAVLELNIYGN